MIEDHAIALFVAVLVLPFIFGGIIAFLTRPTKTYYKHQDGAWHRKEH